MRVGLGIVCLGLAAFWVWGLWAADQKVKNVIRQPPRTSKMWRCHCGDPSLRGIAHAELRCVTHAQLLRMVRRRQRRERGD